MPTDEWTIEEFDKFLWLGSRNWIDLEAIAEQIVTKTAKQLFEKAKELLEKIKKGENEDGE